jgi:hypothetical protein
MILAVPLLITAMAVGISPLADAGARSKSSAMVASLKVSGSLGGVAATSARDAWAVGFTGSKTLILRWNGVRWTRVPSPSPGATASLAGVAVTSARSAWAVGTSSNNDFTSSKTVILRWNGARWTRVPSPSPGAIASLSGVAATSAGSAWAVGTTSSSGFTSRQTVILRWNGARWTRVRSPSPGAVASLAGVAATSARDAWAVGSTGAGTTLILRWNGAAWNKVMSPSPGIDGGRAGIAAGSVRSAWAVGSRMSRAVFASVTLRWTGSAWKAVRSPVRGGNSSLSGVAASSARTAWAVGYTGYPDVGDPIKTLILRWNGTAWKREPSPSPGFQSLLYGVAVTSARNAWAVGTYDGKILILRWNGAAWK